MRVRRSLLIAVVLGLVASISLPGGPVGADSPPDLDISASYVSPGDEVTVDAYGCVGTFGAGQVTLTANGLFGPSDPAVAVGGDGFWVFRGTTADLGAAGAVVQVSASCRVQVGPDSFDSFAYTPVTVSVRASGSPPTVDQPLGISPNPAVVGETVTVSGTKCFPAPGYDAMAFVAGPYSGVYLTAPVAADGSWSVTFTAFDPGGRDPQILLEAGCQPASTGPGVQYGPFPLNIRRVTTTTTGTTMTTGPATTVPTTGSDGAATAVPPATPVQAPASFTG